MSDIKRYRDLLQRRHIRHWFSFKIGNTMWFSASNQYGIGRHVNMLSDDWTLTTFSFGPFQLFKLKEFSDE